MLIFKNDEIFIFRNKDLYVEVDLKLIGKYNIEAVLSTLNFLQ